MGKTSSAVKRKYNEKTYKRFTADLRIEDFERIEELRGNMSRAEFLKFLVSKYAKSLTEYSAENN